MKKVLIAANISDAFSAHLTAKGYHQVWYDVDQMQFDVQGIITSTKLKLDQSTLEKFTELQWIARLGSGMEIIDTTYCKERGIAVASSPAGIANAVGEHCVAMIVALLKNITQSFSEIQHQQWFREKNRGNELEGMHIGIIGYGHTGRAFIQKLMGFGVTFLVYDKYKTNYGNETINEVSLEELQQRADIISFHVPANEETKHYYDAAFINKCQQHYLLNTSRGDIVDTTALLTALASGKVRGAALDVLEKENELLDEKSPHWNTIKKLLSYNTIITPHIAGYSFEAIDKMSAELLEKLKEVI